HAVPGGEDGLMSETSRKPELTELLCFDIYAASRAVTAVYRHVLAELGLTYPQYLVLVVLWDKQTCTINGLRDLLHLDYGTLTPLLRRMESRGLLTRQRRGDDERSVQIELTDAGLELEPRARHVQGVVRQAVGLTYEQAATLQDTLRKVTESATDYAVGVGHD
ncbi:MAG: MarR family transcriptional regulator, partial [Nakamurella sp.]